MTKLIQIKPTNEDINAVLTVTPRTWKKYNRWVEILEEMNNLIFAQVPITDPIYNKLQSEKELCEYTLKNAGFANKHYFRTSWVIC